MEVASNEKLKARKGVVVTAEGHKARRVGRTYWKKDVSWIKKCPKSRVSGEQSVWRAEVSEEKKMMVKESSEAQESGRTAPSYTRKMGRPGALSWSGTTQRKERSNQNDTGKKKQDPRSDGRRQIVVCNDTISNPCAFTFAHAEGGGREGASGWQMFACLFGLCSCLVKWAPPIRPTGFGVWEEGCGQNGGGASSCRFRRARLPGLAFCAQTASAAFFLFSPLLFRFLFFPGGC